MTTVVLVDDHTMLRQGLRRALEGEGIKVVGEAADGEEGVKICLATKPDVVLMDVSMPGTDGIDATKKLVGADNRMRVVMLTMHIDRDVIDRAIKAGAVGYLTKDASISEVLEAIRLAANGDRPMSPRLAEAMLTVRRTITKTTLPTSKRSVHACRLTKRDRALDGADDTEEWLFFFAGSATWSVFPSSVSDRSGTVDSMEAERRANC